MQRTKIMGMAAGTRALWVVLAFWLAPAAAQPADHVVTGCLAMRDTRARSAPPGRDDINRVDDVVVQILFTDLLGNEWVAAPAPASAPLRTDADGCFGALLTLVPERTSIRAAFLLRSDERRVKQGPAIWRLVLPLDARVTVGPGDAAVLGTRALPLVVSEAEGNAPLQMWINAHDVVTRYEAAVGPYDSAALPRPPVVVQFPISGNSNANAARIAIKGDHRDRWNVFLHEFGHYLAANDATTHLLRSSYCLEKPGSSWPFTQSPYRYLEPEGPCPVAGAGHNDRSFEAADNAMGEGFADFTRYFLIDESTSLDASGSPGARYCSRWRGVKLEDNNGIAHNYNSVNFDGDQNETNAAQVLCDLVDDEFESVTYLHQVGEPGHVTPLELAGRVPNLRSTLGMNPTHAFVAEGTEVFSVDFATGVTASVFDAGTVRDLEGVAADATRVCATDGDEVVCHSLSAAGPLGTVALPAGLRGGEIQDIQLVGGELYVMAAYFGASGTVPLRIHRFDASAAAWVMVYEEYVGGLLLKEWPRRFAVHRSTGADKLFLARSGRVESCDASACASTSLYVGDAFGAEGYRRGSLSGALLRGIHQLVRVPGGNELFIVDQYGVSVLRDGDVELEQWVGRGLDRVFENNLSRRGLVLGGVHQGRVDADVRPLYANNGTVEIILDHKGSDFTSDRIKVREDEDELDLLRAYRIDSLVASSDELFCAQENVALPPEDVFTMYQGQASRTTIGNALTSYLSLPAAQADDVLETSWVKLSPPGNCEFESIRRARYDGGGSPPGDEEPREDDECDGIPEETKEDRAEEGVISQVLALEESGTPTDEGNVDPEGLPVLEGSACEGGGPDLDGDGICDAFDTCLLVADPRQIDTDGDGCGNVCDGDFDQDGIVGGPDFTIFVGAFRASYSGVGVVNPHTDANDDGIVGGPDFASFRSQYVRGAPGPSLRSDRSVLACP